MGKGGIAVPQKVELEASSEGDVALWQTALRRQRPGLRRDRFLHGADAVWLDERGQPMTARQWQEPSRRFLALRLDGQEPLLLLLNAGSEPVSFPVDTAAWELLLDTADSGGAIAARSVQLWAAV